MDEEKGTWRLTRSVGDGITSGGMESLEVYVCTRCFCLVANNYSTQHAQWHLDSKIGLRLA